MLEVSGRSGLAHQLLNSIMPTQYLCRRHEGLDGDIAMEQGVVALVNDTVLATARFLEFLVAAH
jgi:hypothetical protein